MLSEHIERSLVSLVPHAVNAEKHLIVPKLLKSLEAFHEEVRRSTIRSLAAMSRIFPTSSRPALKSVLSCQRRSLMPWGHTRCKSYGKGGVVGLGSELEHANAMLTTTFAAPLRDAVGGAQAWIPSFTKLAAPGCLIDVPPGAQRCTRRSVAL